MLILLALGLRLHLDGRNWCRIKSVRVHKVGLRWHFRTDLFVTRRCNPGLKLRSCQRLAIQLELYLFTPYGATLSLSGCSLLKRTAESILVSALLPQTALSEFVLVAYCLNFATLLTDPSLLCFA